MSDVQVAAEWWQASDGKWYPPTLQSGHTYGVTSQQPPSSITASALARPGMLGHKVVATVVGVLLGVVGVIVWQTFVAEPSFESVKDVAVALHASGDGCGELEMDDDFTMHLGPKPVEEGTCEFDGESITITTYKDAGVVENALGVLKGAGCEFGAILGVKNVPVTSGDNWVVRAQSESTIKILAEELGTEPDVIRC